MGTFNWRNAFSTLKRATMMEDPPMSPMTQAEARLRTRIITDAPSGLDALLSDGSANDSSGFPPGAIASPSDPHQNWTDRFQPPPQPSKCNALVEPRAKLEQQQRWRVAAVQKWSLMMATRCLSS